MKCLLLLVTLLLAGCDNDIKPQTRTVQIWLDSPLSQLQSALGDDLPKDCDDKICFYEFTMPVRSGNVLNLILGGDKPFRIDGVFSLTVVLYKQEDNDRINDLSFSPVGPPVDALHSEAKHYFYQLVDTLQAAGWQRYIRPYDPRLPGSEMANAGRIEKALTVPTLAVPYNDPTLRLNTQQWLELPIFSDWYFYRGNHYLTLSVQRENSESVPAERGTYLFTFKFTSEQRHYTAFFDYEERAQWKTRLPALLKKMAAERAAQEKQLRATGIHIDENYRDPEITALKNAPTK